MEFPTYSLCHDLTESFKNQRHITLLLTYRMSHRYWANFSTSYLWLEPIFLNPDSIPMTHETWQSSKASIIGIEITFRTFIKQNKEYEGFFLSVALGNLIT